MQVKKYVAASVLEALKTVKEDLGPEAIILSTQEGKRSLTGQKQFIVVAAISDQQLRKKQFAEKTLGRVFDEKVKTKSARQQKQVIESVYNKLEEKVVQKQRKLTSVPYIDIEDGDSDETVSAPVVAKTREEVSPSSSQVRVQQAVQAAFKTSMKSELIPLKSSTVQKLPEMTPVVSVLPGLREMEERFKQCGVESSIFKDWSELCQRSLAGEMASKANVDAWFAKKIMQTIQVIDNHQDSQIEVFVGPQGSGKTTSLVKAAAFQSVQMGRKVAVITTDLRKVGALDQIRTFCRILNLPFYVARNTSELALQITELAQMDKIFIDTPGVSLSNLEDLNFIRPFASLKNQTAARVHLVISALTKNTDLGGLLKRFRVSDFDDVIMTNIDQTSQHGILLNTQLRTGKPYHSFGINPDIIDGFELATKERVLDLIFKLTKKSGERENDSSL